MYIKTKCKGCGAEEYHEIKLHALEKKPFADVNGAATYAVENIEVSGSMTEEEFAREILKDVQPYIKKGVAR